MEIENLTRTGGVSKHDIIRRGRAIPGADDGKLALLSHEVNEETYGFLYFTPENSDIPEFICAGKTGIWMQDVANEFILERSHLIQVLKNAETSRSKDNDADSASPEELFVAAVAQTSGYADTYVVDNAQKNGCPEDLFVAAVANGYQFIAHPFGEVSLRRKLDLDGTEIELTTSCDQWQNSRDEIVSAEEMIWETTVAVSGTERQLTESSVLELLDLKGAIELGNLIEYAVKEGYAPEKGQPAYFLSREQFFSSIGLDWEFADAPEASAAMESLEELTLKIAENEPAVEQLSFGF